jgi:hypothetical protein
MILMDEGWSDLKMSKMAKDARSGKSDFPRNLSMQRNLMCAWLAIGLGFVMLISQYRNPTNAVEDSKALMDGV